MDVVVPDEQLSLAIGRRGQNVRLASQLTRWDIDILTEAEESERRQEEFRRRTGLFVEALDVDDVIAGLLVTEGFNSIEELAYVPRDELAEIEGFDEGVADELIRRAEAFLLRRDDELTEKRLTLGVTDDIAAFDLFTPQMLVTLGEKGIKTLDDLADLAGDELVEILGAEAIEEAAANEIIMAARAHWFDGEAGAEAGTEAVGEAGADEAVHEHAAPKRSLQTTDAAPHFAIPPQGQIPDGQALAGDVPEEDDLDRERGPQRRCIVTREQGDRASMLRFVVGPGRSIVPDLGARLPGRGYWLSARANVLEGGTLDASRRKGGLASAFARAARGQVIVPADLAVMVRAGLVRRITDHLGLARRAGQAVAGFEKAREWIVAGRAGLVVQASDGSEDERRRVLSGAAGLPVAWPLDGAALGSVFGRERAVHVAVASGRLATLVLIEIERLAGVSGVTLTRQAGE